MFHVVVNSLPDEITYLVCLFITCTGTVYPAVESYFEKMLKQSCIFITHIRYLKHSSMTGALCKNSKI